MLAPLSIVRSAWRPFHIEFGSFKIKLETAAKDVKYCIELAGAHAAVRERQTQETSRNQLVRFMARRDQSVAEAREHSLRKAQQRKRRHCNPLRRDLSDFDPQVTIVIVSLKSCRRINTTLHIRRLV